MAPPHVSLGYKCFHNLMIFIHSSITLARGGGGHNFLQNVYLIIATIIADLAGWPGLRECIYIAVYGKQA